MEKILITGVAGGLGNLIASKLCTEYEIIGIDNRPYRRFWKYPGEFIQANYTQRTFNEIFHKHQFKKVLHLSRMRELNAIENANHFNFLLLPEHTHFNLMATSHLLDLCGKYDVETILILSTFHVYGADSQNPVNITEDHPLFAIQQKCFAVLEALEFDHLATSYLWKNRNSRTVIIRPCNIVGPHINNTVTKMLRSKFIPHLMGFDPMQQFIHESDLIYAIQLILDDPKLMGIYNIAAGGAIPTKEVIKLRQSKSISIPHHFASSFLNTLLICGIGFPSSLIDYFRYPVIISDKKFRTESGYQHKKDVISTLEEI